MTNFIKIKKTDFIVVACINLFYFLVVLLSFILYITKVGQPSGVYQINYLMFRIDTQRAAILHSGLMTVLLLITLYFILQPSKKGWWFLFLSYCLGMIVNIQNLDSIGIVLSVLLVFWLFYRWPCFVVKE